MSDPVGDRLNVIERGLRAEVEEYREAIAAVDLLLVVSARMPGGDALDGTVACLRRLRGELGGCKLQALTALGLLAHSRVYATRMGCAD
nr:MAG TPA: hypothetical protein [Caudoviricetes sp.]